MKTLIVCIAMSASALAQDEHLGKVASPQKMGKPTWIMCIDPDHTALEQTRETTMLYFVKKAPERGVLAQPEQSDFIKDIRDSFPLLHLRRYELDTSVSMFGKFSEWCAVAKKNNVKNYEKEIGKTERGNQSFIFSVKNTVPSLIVRGSSQADASLDEFDAATVLALITKLPELDAKTFKKKPQDARGDLFK